MYMFPIYFYWYKIFFTRHLVTNLIILRKFFNQHCCCNVQCSSRFWSGDEITPFSFTSFFAFLAIKFDTPNSVSICVKIQLFGIFVNICIFMLLSFVALHFFFSISLLWLESESGIPEFKLSIFVWYASVTLFSFSSGYLFSLKCFFLMGDSSIAMRLLFIASISSHFSGVQNAFTSGSSKSSCSDSELSECKATCLWKLKIQLHMLSPLCCYVLKYCYL